MIDMDIKDYFKRNRKCVISGITAAAVIAGSCFTGAALKPQKTYSYEQEAVMAENEEAKSETEVLTADTVADELESKFGVTQKDVYKDETVYAFASADGSVDNVIVSEWLRNPEKKSELTDKTNLKDIENVKGDEAFTQNGDELTWQANGNDIYYQGTTTQELPVSVKVTYYLNGNEMKPEDMAGVSGNVKIRFDYTNNTSVEKEINGKKEEIKVPFVAISGLILNENCTNVTVENGRTMPQGSSTIVIGYGVPGIKDSLGLEDSDLSEELSLPDYFEVSADVTDFSLDMTMTAVVSASEFAFDGNLDTSEIDDMVDTVSEAGESLAEGSDELAEGTETLLTKMGEFSTGANQVAAGANQVATGADQLSTGANQVATGAGQLKDGVDTLASKSESLASGVTAINDGAQAISTGVAQLDAGLNTPMSDEEKTAAANQAATQAANEVSAGFAEGSTYYNKIYDDATANYVETMQGSAAAISGGLKGNDQLVNSIAVGIAYSQYGQAKANGTIDEAVSFDDYLTAVGGVGEFVQYAEGALDTAGQQVAYGMASNENAKAAFGQSVVEACKTSAVTAASAAAGEAVVAGAEGAKATIAKQIEDGGLVSGAKDLADGTQALNDKIPDLTSGIGQLSNGADQLAAGSSQLATGSSQLANGTSQLVSGSNKLANGSEQLEAGVKQLSEGAGKLSDGMNQFNDEAIKKIVEAYNGDIKDIAGRLDAVLEVSSEYQTFTEINDGDAGVTKFIIKTNGITE